MVWEGLLTANNDVLKKAVLTIIAVTNYSHHMSKPAVTERPDRASRSVKYVKHK